MKDPNKTLLSVNDLRTYYYPGNSLEHPIKAVDDVTFSINEREIVGIVGESGSGKSTIAFSILRLIFPPGKIIGGMITYKGNKVLDLNENEMRKIRGKEIALVFQDPTTDLNPVMKIKDQIRETITTHEKCGSELTTEKSVEILKKVRLSPEILNRYPFELSGGMQQRCVMAIALSCSPSLLIMDEPTTALDATIQAQILGLIKSIRDTSDTAIILVTHDLGIVAEICDKVNVVYTGKIVEQADIFDLYESPMHPYTRGLLDSILSINEFKEKLVTIEGSTPDPTHLPKGCLFHPRCGDVMPICKEKMPPLITLDDNHNVRCWKYST